MGRRKIQIQPIKDDRNRQVTFLKRKHGLMKKAYELSVLCNCEVALFIIPSNNKIIQYSSSNMEQLLDEFQQNDLPREIKSNEDFMENKEEEESDNEESLKQCNRVMIQDQLALNHNNMVSSSSSSSSSYNTASYQSSYTTPLHQQHTMLQVHAHHQQPMYLFQQHQPPTTTTHKSTPNLYHSPNTLSPDQSPKSDPGTPEKKRKLSSNNNGPSSSHPLSMGIHPHHNGTLGIPTIHHHPQFAQHLPTTTSYYPDFYQPTTNFIVNPIQTGHNHNSANASFMMPTSSSSSSLKRKH